MSEKRKPPKRKPSAKKPSRRRAHGPLRVRDLIPPGSTESNLIYYLARWMSFDESRSTAEIISNCLESNGVRPPDPPAMARDIRGGIQSTDDPAERDDLSAALSLARDRTIERCAIACIDMPQSDGTTYTYWPCVNAIRALALEPERAGSSISGDGSGKALPEILDFDGYVERVTLDQVLPPPAHGGADCYGDVNDTGGQAQSPEPPPARDIRGARDTRTFQQRAADFLKSVEAFCKSSKP